MRRVKSFERCDAAEENALTEVPFAMARRPRFIRSWNWGSGRAGAGG